MSYCVGKFIWPNDTGVTLAIFTTISPSFAKSIVRDTKEVKENLEVKCLEAILSLRFINGHARHTNRKKDYSYSVRKPRCKP